MEIGDFLKAIRTEQGLTQSEAAKLMKVGVRTYQYYENGSRDITLRRLAIFVQKLKYKGVVKKFKEHFDFFVYKDTAINGLFNIFRRHILLVV